MPPLSNLAARDVETLVHPYINLSSFRETGPLIIERAHGVYVYDTEGKPYIEGMAGLWCTALGYGNEELVQAAAEQMRKLSFAHLFTGRSHDPAIELAEKLKEIAPIPISKVFFCNSGSEANDTQVKLVWYLNNALGRPQKKKIISRIKAYHGVTVAAASLTGLPANHRDFDLPLPGFLHAGCPHHYRFAQEGETEGTFATRLAAELEALILKEGPDTVAAFIAEPVMGAGGVISAPREYWTRIRQICDKYDVLMVMDEVITGAGRTGKMFACEHWDVRPDIISCAKGISSGYLPLGAVIVHERIYQTLLDSSAGAAVWHGFTNTGNPACCAAGSKTLEIIERDGVVENARRMGERLHQRLQELRSSRIVGEIRGLGLMAGVELVRNPKTREAFPEALGVGGHFRDVAREHGLLIRAVGDTVCMSPPLIITPKEIDLLIDRLKIALAQTESWLAGQKQ
jgi:4-aminobutyrate--pyruvate transaminase